MFFGNATDRAIAALNKIATNLDKAVGEHETDAGRLGERIVSLQFQQVGAELEAARAKRIKAKIEELIA